MALKRARWTDEDIAAEMRMEPAEERQKTKEPKEQGTGIWAGLL